ncbi:MAG: efflux RND transporter permease subunit [Proteobacteria bacterium]|nr:efflux RND transporter permease subunit [Pseudomonadota bacterium]MBS0574214.1 efflux RND transporter permease subunit [Pseudomonadota bacterium]
MSISAIFIRRPVATILLMVGILGAGSIAYTKLPVAALPRADFPTISVSAQLAGASPDTMASSVATPLIKQFQTIAGIDTISASSSLGSTQISIQFDLGRNIDAAAADIQAAIARAQRQLPSNMTTPPSYRKSNPADAPILILALTSDQAELTRMDDLAQNVVSPALSTISGVAQAQVFGSKTYAVRVEADPERLDSRGLALNDLVAALKAANAQTPVGTLIGPSQAMTIDVPTQRTNAADFASLVIAQPGGRVVRLSDVARVVDSIENPNQGSWLDGTPSIVLGVFRQPDANTVAVVDAVRAELPKIEAGLPAGMHVSVLNDASVSIRHAVSEVQKTFALTIGLVILVIFLFLRRLRATLIPALAVPLSLVATFAGMYFLGYSIDNISLLGLTLSVGLVVDDAIVMLENIIRRVEHGEPPMQAALNGSAEITGTIISMSLSLVAVFLPILLMGGVVGRILNEFGVVVTIAILSSAVVSLTISPMLAARLPRSETVPAPATSAAARMTRAYGRAVGWCLRHPAPILALFVVTTIASGYVYSRLPRSFLPTEDTGILNISTQARQDISFQAMKVLQAEVAAAVARDPAVDHVVSNQGGSFNSGSLFVQLKPQGDRPPLDQTLTSLRRSLAQIAGVRSFITPQQSLRLTGRSSQSQYQVVLQALDAQLARDWSDRLRAAMQADSATFVDVASDLQDGALQARVDVDRDRAATLGVSPDILRSTLQAAFGSLVATQIQTTGNSYDVIIELDPNRDWSEQTLAGLRIPSAGGTLVPLSSFATVSRASGPVSVNQTGQLASVTLSFNLPEGVSLGTATARVQTLRGQIGMPSSVTTGLAGTAQLFQQATDNTGLLIAAAVLTIYVVLGVLYESFVHPLTILSGLPSAALGALLALWVWGLDFSIIALIGLLMLIGIVKKNAIMMIDVALDLRRREGRPAAEAIHEAAVRRLRPIMMTTFAALLSALPIALGSGAGAELRQPLGVAVVGGLLVSQALTLFITPVIFVSLEAIAARLRRRRGPAPVAAPEDAAALRARADA